MHEFVNQLSTQELDYKLYRTINNFLRYKNLFWAIIMEDEEGDRKLADLLEQTLHADRNQFMKAIIRMLDLKSTSQDKQSPESCQTHPTKK